MLCMKLCHLLLHHALSEEDKEKQYHNMCRINKKGAVCSHSSSHLFPSVGRCTNTAAEFGEPKTWELWVSARMALQSGMLSEPYPAATSYETVFHCEMNNGHHILCASAGNLGLPTTQWRPQRLCVLTVNSAVHHASCMCTGFQDIKCLLCTHKHHLTRIPLAAKFTNCWQ